MKREEVLRKGPYPMLIDGKEVPSLSGKTFPSIDPSTGKVLAEVYEAGVEDVSLAVGAARKAFDKVWSSTLPRERSKKLMKLAGLLAGKAEMLSWLECYDAGKPIAASRAWLAGGPGTLEYYAGCLLGLSGETLDVSDRTLLDFTLREPLGVCGLIVPWNFPLSIALLKMAPALAAGNCVVIKPSEVTPLSTVELGALVAEAGFPPGVVNIVNGPGDPVGAALVRDPRVAKISFTGGTESGKRIFREAAETVKRLTLELGGKSASLVFADADLDKAVNVAFTDIVRNSGQVCGACTRVLLEESVADAFVEKLETKLRAVKVGAPESPDTEMGPLVSSAQAGKVRKYLDIGKSEGASAKAYVDLSGRGDLASDAFLPPMLFHGATNAMRVAREEIFGPILTVMRFRTEEEAVAITNDTRYGLAACVFTRDATRAMRMVRTVSAGTVCVNTGVRSSVDAPFGGFRESGIGKERGKEALLDDTQLKNVRFGL
ncbi:MAG: aldehyde dehydrogenase family protein [Betaproteobacteria bacterium]|nr:aldehyde dehydrogenase family protein [Betaproteobacteria bacterium]